MHNQEKTFLKHFNNWIFREHLEITFLELNGKVSETDFCSALHVWFKLVPLKPAEPP